MHLVRPARFVMPELKVFPDHERDEIRARLQAYQEAHSIGAPKLQLWMEMMLDVRDQRYIDLRSLQRFLVDKGRTDDEKVVRYRKFLKIVQADRRIDGIVDYMTWRREEEHNQTPPALVQKFAEHRRQLAALQGRYLVHRRPSGTTHSESGNYGSALLSVFVPSECGRFLKSYYAFSFRPRDTDMENLRAEMRVKGEGGGQDYGMLFPKGPENFLLVHGNEIAMLRSAAMTLAETPIMEGPLMQDEELSEGLLTLRLERVAGLETRLPNKPEWLHDIPDLSGLLRDDPP
jgi:hypothetical protein